MFSKSIPKLVISTLVLFCAICLFGFAANAQKSSKSGGNVSVTGCLQKGEEADEFSLTGDDGKLYGLRSSSVKLVEHVGHKVTFSICSSVP